MKILTGLKNYVKRHKESIVFFSVFLLAVFCSVSSFLYYYTHGLTLAYGDAKVHLNIARRVIFSLTPGAAQLGGIWLPLPHIFDLLTVWNNFMYYSGLSGSIISMCSYIVAVLVIYKALYFYTKNLASSFLGALVMMTSPSFLYFQTTPMTELPSITLSLIAIYLLIKWARSHNLATLILAAFVTAVSSLSRYDNWFLVVASFLIVISIELLRHKNIKVVEGSFLLFSVLASFGIVLWLLYNLLLFGNALNFALGNGSASWFATNQHALTKHNLYLSILTFVWLIIDNIGIIPLIFMLVGVFVFLLQYKLKPTSVSAYLFLAPVIFNIASLYLGQSIAFTQHLPPYELYNTRYGLNALPATAFFIGILFYLLIKFKNIRILAFPLLIVLAINYASMFSSPPILLKDATSTNLSNEQNAVTWLLKHPDDGLVLVSTGTFDTLVFDARIPEEKIIYEGSGKFWRESLKAPKTYAERVIVGENLFGTGSDPVGNALLKTSVLKKDYHIVFSNPYVTVYDINSN